MGGKVIKTAVRLQSAAQAGQVLICDRTHDRLNGDLKPDFGKRPQKVRGKPHEGQQIKAWSYSVYTSSQKKRKKPHSLAKTAKRSKRIKTQRKANKVQKGKVRRRK